MTNKKQHVHAVARCVERGERSNGAPSMRHPLGLAGQRNAAAASAGATLASG